MKEQNGNEKSVNEKNEKNEKNKSEKKKKSRISDEKRFYLITAIGCAVALIAIVVIAAVVSNANNTEGMRNPHSSSTPTESSTPADDSSDTSSKPSPDSGSSGDEPVGGETEGMALPVAKVTVGNDYGFCHNQTLNNYYEHMGVDFMAEVGAEVFAVEDGVVESIYKDDLLLGTEIVVSHANGVKSAYRFVTEKEGLKVGDRVKKGDVIATVAEPTGNEYKDGAHLHFEITANGVNVDPDIYLTLEEK